jgi:ribosomal protein S18 acetylase RimI-like enzyme
MNKFNLTVGANNIASQIADLINSGKQIWYHLTAFSILNRSVKFLIEMDRDKIIGVIGLEQKNSYVTELKYLCVHSNYRKCGLGEKLLRLGINSALTEFVYGTVRSDNRASTRNSFRCGMKPIGKYKGRGCNIIIFARRKKDVKSSIRQRRAY